MDDDQFEQFVQFASSYFSSPGLFLNSTAAEGRARGYLLRDRPRGEKGDSLLTRFIAESQFDKSSWDALDLIAQELIRKGEPLPAALGKWTADVLADLVAERGQKRRPRPGKGHHATAGRDWNAYFLIDRLIKIWNLKPTRNEISEPCSACDVVADALDLPYKTVTRIWTTCSHQMHKA